MFWLCHFLPEKSWRILPPPPASQFTRENSWKMAWDPPGTGRRALRLSSQPTKDKRTSWNSGGKIMHFVILKMFIKLFTILVLTKGFVIYVPSLYPILTELMLQHLLRRHPRISAFAKPGRCNALWMAWVKSYDAGSREKHRRPK